MNKEEPQTQKVLYKDLNVKITEKSVKVLKFYFPQDSGDQILFKEISKLGMRDMDEMDEALGVSPQFFKGFKERVKQGKNVYIQMAIADDSVRLCFAPDEPLKVLKLIEQKWTQAKKQQSGTSQKALQQNTLYTNVEVTAEKIQQVMEQLKKSEEQDNLSSMKKRSIESTGNKTVEPQEGETPKKKVKESGDQERENKLPTKEEFETK